MLLLKHSSLLTNTYKLPKNDNPTLTLTLLSAAQQCKKPVIRDGIVTGPTPLIPNNTLIVQCETGHTLTSVVPITCVTLEEYDPPLLPHCAPGMCYENAMLLK